jgi:predicted GNAT family acetyltransferase
MVIAVVDNPAAQRFEATVDGQLSVLEYRIDGKTLVLRHTEVPRALSGHGIAAALTKYAMDCARERGIDVVPKCVYAAAWIKRHPEYADLVRADS